MRSLALWKLLCLAATSLSYLWRFGWLRSDALTCPALCHWDDLVLEDLNVPVLSALKPLALQVLPWTGAIDHRMLVTIGISTFKACTCFRCGLNYSWLIIDKLGSLPLVSWDSHHWMLLLDCRCINWAFGRSRVFHSQLRLQIQWAEPLIGDTLLEALSWPLK